MQILTRKDEGVVGEGEIAARSPLPHRRMPKIIAALAMIQLVQLFPHPLTIHPPVRRKKQLNTSNVVNIIRKEITSL